MQYFIANFKQNLDYSQAQSWLEELADRHTPQPNKKVILAPSFPLLPFFKQTTNLPLAAQDVSPFSPGAHTGQVGADQLQDLVQFSIVGHSETRQPNDQDTVTQKIQQLIKHQITPLICLDKPYLQSQIDSLQNHSLDSSAFLYAYEPAAAIGSGDPQDPQQANQIARQIQKLTQSQTVIYGGSVDSQNVQDFISQKNISGVLVGSASLDPIEFAKIVSCE